MAALANLLANAGCRISEALALTVERLDQDALCVVFLTLKRRKLTYRAVPIPATLMAELLLLAKGLPKDARLWPWCRQTGWRKVKALMLEAGIDGPRACPKGLRHAYGVAAAEQKVPPGTIQRWMGHARLETTAIYQTATGQEERRIARRLWLT